jgi:ankyrin repeat protein
LVSVVEAILAAPNYDGNEPDLKDALGQTALSWATESGHKAVMEPLLKNETVDPDSKSALDETPLSWAAANGHKAVVELLLKNEGGF